MGFWALLAAVLLVVASAARAEDDPVTAMLRPAEESIPADASHAPYAPAILTLDHPLAATEIRIRNAAGGPTRVYPLPPATEGRRRLRVYLPAIAPTEVYQLRLVNGRENSDVAFSAELQWPAGVATPEAFLTPVLYSDWQGQLPDWPASLKRTLALVLAGVVLLSTATLLLPRRRWRLTGMLLVVLGGAGGTAWAASRVETTVLTQHNDVLVVRCRRSQPALRIPPGWMPVYETRRQFREDSLVQPAENPSTLTISPDEVRIFRRMGRDSSN